MKTLIVVCSLILSACAVRAADVSFNSRAAASHSSKRCNDGTNPRRGENGFLCIEPTKIYPQSFCLRKTGLDPVHVRAGKDIDAFLTPNGTNGEFGYARAEVPLQQGEVCTPKISFLTDKQLVHIEKGSGDDKLLLQTIPVDPGLDLVIDKPVELTLHKGGKNDGYFYARGTIKGVDIYLMLADDYNGFMNADDESDVPRIEHYFRLEAFASGDSNCKEHRPDVDPGDNMSYFKNFYRWKKNDATCNTVGHSDESGTGGGGHQWP